MRRLVLLALAGAVSVPLAVRLPVAPATDAPAAQAVPRVGAPESFSPLVRGLLPAVVNISTTQTLGGSRANRPDAPDVPQAPPGSPFEEFFRDFFNRQRPPGGQNEA